MFHREDVGKSSLVWIESEHIHGVMVGPMGSHYSRVFYVRDGVEYDTLIETDDLTEIDLD